MSPNAAAAALVGVDLSAEFSVGDHTPALEAPDEPLPIDDSHVRTPGALRPRRDRHGQRPEDQPRSLTGRLLRARAVRLRGSVVSRPTRDEAYWNAPFGALRHAAELPADGRRAAAVDFLRDGLGRFSSRQANTAGRPPVCTNTTSVPGRQRPVAALPSSPAKPFAVYVSSSTHPPCTAAHCAASAPAGVGTA